MPSTDYAPVFVEHSDSDSDSLVSSDADQLLREGFYAQIDTAELLSLIDDPGEDLEAVFTELGCRMLSGTLAARGDALLVPSFFFSASLRL